MLRASLTVGIIILTSAAPLAAQHRPSKPTISPKAPVFVKAFVADDRLSVLRREPDLKSPIIHRLRIARPVYIFGAKASAGDQPAFCRVAVSRRTRGWMHQSALVRPGRLGEDERLMSLIDRTNDPLDKIALCNLLVAKFPHSPLVPGALLAIGGEAERSAASLNHHAHKRLAEVNESHPNASVRDYYLNDSGLDRYNKLRVTFDFNQITGEYVYDGRAFREILARFPDSNESRSAQRRLDLTQRRLARQQ